MAVYDPVKAHEYYVKNRELKGRPKASDLKKDSQKEGFAYVQNQLAERKAFTSKMAVQSHAKEIQKFRDKAKQRNLEVMGKIKVVLDRIAAESKADMERISKETQAKIDALPPIPKGLSQEQTAALAAQRREDIAKIRGDANAEAGKIRERVASSREGVRNFGIKSREVVASELKASVDQAKVKYNTLKDALAKKYERDLNAEFETSKPMSDKDEGKPMESDFSGYATKAGLKCTDGRTIMPDAFKHQDTMQVPLVWQHGHNDPENVLGHVMLENRNDGVYAYGFFNNSTKARHMKEAVDHKDIKMMSIYANELIERTKRVMHGVIREVSLVLSGANPGALIENVTIRHSDGEEIDLDDEAVIYTGLEIELSHADSDVPNPDPEPEPEPEPKPSEDDTSVEHAAGDDDDDETVQDVYDTLSEKQKNLVHYMIGKALEEDTGADMSQSNIADTGDQNDNDTEGSDTMSHNVFEKKDDDKTPQYTLTHSDLSGIMENAQKSGSLKDAVGEFALAHGINDIDVLFPEAQALLTTPEFLSRRTEWVAKVLGAAHKSPFARIKTISADITEDEARAKGYITGTLKKEEFFGVTKRVTTPTTIYKKQKLDRDDMVDITDFDVVAWLRAEMRLMLDEELARAILLGDGRDVSHDDKINEQNIRPIAKDHELFTTSLYVNIGDASSSVQEIVDSIVTHRRFYKGTGLPTFFTTELYISRFLLLKDTLGRRIYKDLNELATELRVAEIVPVEVMEEEDEIIGVIVNMQDYNVGADKGGSVSMFDDFDIDYNQYKYLIETRVSGALTKLKSAMVIKKTGSSATLVTPTVPTFNTTTGVTTIPTQTGTDYFNAADLDTELTAGAQTAIAAGASITIVAVPTSSSYYFANDEEDNWTFTRDE